ncbi:helix-turn-helix domain-containing protein [Aeromonas sp. s3]|uniref:helix-turn-helix domain-containing protein n=1 Tax=Aeromonas sp. s3 TaxID=3138485 RepID=UPI0034A5B0FF
MLKKLRNNLGLSLCQVAGKLGISESFLSQIENGKRKPSPDLLCAISELLGCDKDEISVSVGIIPTWMVEELRESPKKSVTAAKDKFDKYGTT